MIFKKESFYLALAPVFFLLLFSFVGSFLHRMTLLSSSYSNLYCRQAANISAVPTATAAAFSHVF